MLWVEMPEGTDSVRLFHQAREHGIGIAPGSIFTLGAKYQNCIRLSSAFWDDRSEQGVVAFASRRETAGTRGTPNRTPTTWIPPICRNAGRAGR